MGTMIQNSILKVMYNMCKLLKCNFVSVMINKFVNIEQLETIKRPRKMKVSRDESITKYR